MICWKRGAGPHAHGLTRIHIRRTQERGHAD
ncbi:MAG TPA: branched-chain amino acid ABC transporter permease, partial [Afipia sp.]|nr:branched-chain amino acid ABC transporter permease [Afipia sp.]